MYEEILTEIKRGNLEPLDKIYLEHQVEFMAFARSNYQKLSSESIEDAYQDTIIDVYKNIVSGRLTTIEYSFKAYIFHIGKMKLLKSAERMKKQPVADLSIASQEPIYDPSIGDNWTEVEKAVQFVFSNSSDTCKQILKLFYFDKFSMHQIALQLGYANADTVKAKKNRCINQIATKATGMFTLNV